MCVSVDVFYFIASRKIQQWFILQQPRTTELLAFIYHFLPSTFIENCSVSGKVDRHWRYKIN